MNNEEKIEIITELISDISDRIKDIELIINNKI
jgi:hypothetical protein